MPREIWYLSLPFHLLSYFSCLTTSPFLISFYFSLLAVLCHCCYFLTETRNLNVYSADHLKKKRDHFFPRVQGKSHKITHISSSSLIFRALLFLFAQCMRLHLVFSPQVIISVEGAFTAQSSSAGAHQHHHHSLLCSPASAADSGKTPERKENLQY